MFNKVVDENIIDYVIVSPVEEIFINVLVDDAKFIVQTNVSIILIEDKQDIYNGHKIMDITQHMGPLGFHNAINEVIVYILDNMEEKFYFESDIFELIKTSSQDYMKIESECARMWSKDDGFFGPSKNHSKWKKEYHNA